MAPTTVVSWITRIAIGGVFVMTAAPKLAAQPASQAAFGDPGGPSAMVLTGVLELLGAVLVLVPRTKVLGAVLAIGLMGGAILSHFVVLGLGGTFHLAVLQFVLSIALTVIHRSELPVIGVRFYPTSRRIKRLFDVLARDNVEST